MTKLHPNLKRIGASAFKGNSKIVDAFVSKNIVYIGDSAFMDCYNLKSVTFEEGGTTMTIGASAFANCTKLTAIALPAYTTHIGDSAFEAAQLKTFTIPEATTYLGHKALMGNTFDTIVIPANVEFIGDACFANVPLKNLSFVEGDKPLQLGTLENGAAATGVFYGTKLVNVTLADRVTVIGGYAFYKITTLKTFTISEKGRLEHIGAQAFASNSALESVSFGACLKTIGSTAFKENKKLTKIVLPNTLESLGGSVFYNCTQIEEVYFAPGGTTPLDLDTTANFSFCSAMTKITLPARLRNAYADTVTKNLAANFSSCQKLATIEMEPGSGMFAAIGNVIYELNLNGEPEVLLFCAPGMTGELIVPKEVRMVAYMAFMYTKLTKVAFEDYPEDHENYGQPLLDIGVENTNCNVFYQCSGLARLELPSHLKMLGKSSCTGLTRSGVSVIFNRDAHLKLIDESAMSNAKCTTLDLPLVDYIDITAFKGSTIESITFHPDSTLTSISERVFESCTKLRSIHIPDSIEAIDTHAFYKCSALSEVTFGEKCNLIHIYEYAFAYTALTEFTLPEKVETLDEYALGYCDALKTLTLNSKISYINGSATYKSGLMMVNIPKTNPSLKSVDGVVYDVAETVLLLYPAGKDPTDFKLPDTLLELDSYSMAGFQGSELVLPESLEIIRSYAFREAKIKGIHIPGNVKTIEDYVFFVSSGTVGTLETLTFAENSKLESIGKYAFARTRLKTVDLPDNVKVLGQYAFTECAVLEEVRLPAALQELSSYVFNKCSSLKKLEMQEGLKKINGAVFMATSGFNVIIEELNIPATVEEIANSAFANMYALKKLTFAEGSKLKKLGSYAFQNCIALESVTLPSKLDTLSTASVSQTVGSTKYSYKVGGAFLGCTGLKHVDMSACVSLKTIPTKMFGDCMSLETLILPPKLTTIADYAFGDTMHNLDAYDFDRPVTKVKEITIPATVTSIGAYAFYGFEGLETVTFEKGSKLKKLGELELSSEGNLCNQYIFGNTPNLKTVVLPEALTSIGLGCFENSGVANIEIPTTVTDIGDKAFKNCDNLVNVTFPLEMRTLGGEAFYDCDKLEAAALPGDLEKLGALAFALCEQLKEAYIPATVTRIPGNPFLGCTGVQNFELSQDSVDFAVKDGVLYDKTMYTLIYYPASLTAETFEIPETVHEIGAGAFAGAQLKHFVIPERFHEIPDYAFQASALESITFHRGVTTIGNYAFEGCKNLNDVTMLNSIKHSGNYVFANCTGLTNFVFEEMPENVAPYTIGTHFFDGCTAITQVILPNRMSITDEDEDQVSKIINKEAVIPSYMFANTGIVYAVIPGQITELSTLGVFYNCKQLETVTYVNKDYDSYEVGAYTFYGCSKLKELEIPTGFTNPITQYAFAECTSLEKMTIYTTGTWISPRANGFVGCTNLKSIDVMLVGSFVRDENGMAVEYANVTKDYIYSVNNESFAGMPNMKYLYLGHSEGGSVYTNAFVGSSIEKLVIKRLNNFGGAPIDTPFAGENALKEIWIGGEGANGMRIQQTAFTKLTHDINIYFCNYTLEEVIAMTGSDKWYTDADEKAHFYFKDTIPADVEWPEELKSAE